ncbi:hypothetical protein B0J13DRAFT_619442 [Dactylonectria estremocensis]|uniref:Nuclear membrane fusion protein Kar5 n=1 Tax=Dactylonectria estremocensis TaxID=1079267 RepID=A0A9P9F3W3_9HYPO|nr:hypothetical protein B0J13DRAFT_619442 [Dactylonectria estremocensis]
MAVFASPRDRSSAAKVKGSTMYLDSSIYTTSRGVYHEPQDSNMYTVAFRELQELESEPLCHRIAARLLVNNCHLLDGQDEATIHMDSGRAARDFVDSYAASLAICDLERGSFVIPLSCSKFREAALTALPVSNKPQLHVSTPEIDSCLEGLAQSDSAWNTWVSYRHKTLRFCEAARADNENAQNIHVYQRVTKILEQLTTQIEADMEARLHSLHQAFHETAVSIGTFATQIDKLKTDLGIVDEIAHSQLHHTAKEASKIFEGGLENARGLQQLLAALLRATTDATAEVAASHESALQVATRNVNNEIEALISAISVASSFGLALHNQMEATQSKTKDLFQNQANLEAGMGRLEALADNLLVKFDSHEGRLEQAEQQAVRILDTLDAAIESTAVFSHSFFGGFGLSELWPYVLFPVASLIMGSYGLEPSIGRNIWLVSIGELIGCVVSSASHYADNLLSASSPKQVELNTTFDIEELTDGLNNAVSGKNFRQNNHNHLQ